MLHRKWTIIVFVVLGRRFYLLADTKKYTVGRTPQSDLSLSDDTSVSRDHAVIHRSSSGVKVEDLNSKYGVYINKDIEMNKPIDKNTPVKLQAGNIVRFGRMENVFRLENIEIKVCTSTMSPEGLEHLKKQLKLIDGTFQRVWTTECTHLVMPSVTVTVKVLQSLAYGIPIVSPNYWDAYIEYTRQHKTELPNVMDFVPDITEPYIIKEPGMMAVHFDRQRLFQNKTFVFMVKRHMEQFEPVIKLAAGKCMNMEKDKIRRTFLLKADCIPVQYTPSANTQCSSDVQDIVEYIQSNDRRLISESEIGLAILHRSIDRFCNPDRKMVSDFEPISMDKKKIFKDVLHDEETPPPRNTEPPAPSSIVIPESVDLSGTEPNNNLHAGEAADLDQPSTSSPRKSARLSSKSVQNVSTNFQTPATSKTQKRKHPDENEQEEGAGSDEPKELEQSLPSKKQKTDDANQGENSSAHFVEPMPPPSQNQLNFSGFISTQNRRNRLRTQAPAQSTQTNKSAATAKEKRKRAVNMLDCDSDDNNDENNDNLFNFNRKSKRPKVSSKQGTHSRDTQRNVLDDDDDDNLSFNFSNSRGSSRQSKRKQKATQNEVNEICEADGPAVVESQNAYQKPFQHSMNRTLNRTVIPIEVTSAPKCETDWIILKMKKVVSLNDPPNSNTASNSVQIKEEKLEEWEITDKEKKEKWIKSFANVFSVRKIEVNMSRRSVADETDGMFSDSGNTTLNKTKNFKKFVKVSGIDAIALKKNRDQ